MSRVGKMLVPISIAAVAATALSVGHVAGITPTRAASESQPEVLGGRQEDARAKLRSLFVERKKALADVLRMEEAELKAGRVNPDAVANAHIALLHAEMDLANTRSDRLNVLRKIVDVCADFHNMVAERHAAGHATEIDVQQANAAMLEAEIAVVRETLAE